MPRTAASPLTEQPAYNSRAGAGSWPFAGCARHGPRGSRDHIPGCLPRLPGSAFGAEENAQGREAAPGADPSALPHQRAEARPDLQVVHGGTRGTLTEPAGAGVAAVRLRCWFLGGNRRQTCAKGARRDPQRRKMQLAASGLENHGRGPRSRPHFGTSQTSARFCSRAPAALGNMQPWPAKADSSQPGGKGEGSPGADRGRQQSCTFGIWTLGLSLEVAQTPIAQSS